MSALGQKQTCAVQSPLRALAWRHIRAEAACAGLVREQFGLFKLLARARHLQAGKQLNVTLRARSIALE
jgi:hypothetical protein